MSTIDPFISFIIPCYHSENTIQAALDSIIKAIGDFVTYEIILIAENEDDTSFINLDIHRYNNTSIYYSRYPGVTSNRNKGLKEAKGQYVYFLDSDDVLYVDDWKNALQYVVDHPEIDVLFGKTKNFNDGCDESLKKYSKISNDVEYLDSFYGDWGIVSYSYYSYIIKRTFLLNNNIFVDKKITNAEDYLFVGMMLTKKPIFAASNYTLCVYNIGSSSLSKDRNINSVISFVISFITLYGVLETNNFIKSLDRFIYTFVNVHLESGYRLNRKDKRIFIKTLKEYDVRNNVIKRCSNCNKRSLYLTFGYRLSWLFLKLLHKLKKTY